MAIQAIAPARDTAASDREAARVYAAQIAERASKQRFDSRVQEAKQALAARPRPQDRETPPEPERPSRLFDITV